MNLSKIDSILIVVFRLIETVFKVLIFVIYQSMKFLKDMETKLQDKLHFRGRKVRCFSDDILN